MIYSTTMMRKKKNILLFLLGITLLSLSWYIFTSYGHNFHKFDINHDHGHSHQTVLTMSDDVDHPANSLKHNTVNQQSGIDDLHFEPNEKKNIDIESKIHVTKVVNSDKKQNLLREMNKPEDGNQNLHPTTVAPSDDEYEGDEGLLEIYKFDKKEWATDNKVCSHNEQDKFQEAQMHTAKGDVAIYVHDPKENVHVSGGLVNNGEWEGNLIQLVYKLLQRDPSLQFIDLGANIGVFSLAVAKLGKKVISVEPLTINLKRLCKSVIKNEFEDYITILHNALSDTYEEVTLVKEKGNVGGTFISKDKNENKLQGSSVVGEYSDVVNTVRLDDLLTLPNFESFGKVIIKMDVEGHESHVLNGAERFFRKVDVQGVLMEWMWHKSGSDSNKIIDFFANHGYEPVNPNGFIVLDVRTASSWPVDILWRRREDKGHFHEHAETVPAKNQQVSNNALVDPSNGVKMYRHDMTKWNLDNSMCKTENNFEMVSMHTPAGDVKINIHNPSVDVHVSGGLQRNGQWEPHLIQLMFSLLTEDPTAQFIDLGANLGVFSLAVARFGRKVVAVEPLSINLNRLCKSIQDNGFQNIITVVINALGDTREMVSFGKDVGNIGGTFVLSEKTLEKQRGSAVGGTYDDKVLTAKVDDILNLPGFDFKKVVVKMDVEGFEHYVLHGASEFFSKVDVTAVLMEWMWHKAGSGSQEIFKFYLDRGYEPYDPIRKAVLDIGSSDRWPVDVLWRKKAKPSEPVNQANQQIDQQKPTKNLQTNTDAQMYKRDIKQWVKDTSMCIGTSNLLKVNMHTSSDAGDVTIFVHEPSVDVHVSGSLVRGGSWEPHLIKLMYSLLQRDPDLQFMDLGANLGVFSLSVAAFGRRVVAFEPLSINLHRLCASITANKFEKLITVVTNALSDKREKVTFGKDQGNIGGTFVLNDKNMNKFNGSPVNGKYDDVVLSAKLDDVLKLPGFDFQKVIMKMDVEGYEHHVLRAAHNFFRTVDVQAVLMEWMWQKDGSSAQEIIDFFTQYNYEPYSPNGNIVLETKHSGSWPVDVLWRRKSSGNPYSRQHAMAMDREERQAERNHGIESQGTGRGDLPENTASLQKSMVQHTDTQIAVRPKYGVHFFRRQQETWVEDDSACGVSQNFQKANLHTPGGDVDIFVHNPSEDVHVSGGLLNNEAWEPHLIRLMYDMLNKDSQLQFVDLGANLGVFSLAVAKLGRRVVAVEPLSINLQRFCKSILANHFEDKITVVTNALSDKIENVSFGKDLGNIGGTFVLNDKNMAKYSGSQVGGKFDDVVQTTKLDSLLQLPGFDFTKVIMKIDVEGYEHHVFREAKEFFRRVDVQAVLMEWMWHKSGSESAEILKFFSDHNYEPMNPGTNSRLDVGYYNSWPVDVLWKKVQKSKISHSTSNVPSGFTSGVQVYRHDMTQWQADDSICLNLPSMTKGKISHGYSAVGSFSIFVYDPSVDQYVSGGIIRDGGWETNLVNSVISLLKQDEDLQFVDLGANLGVYALAVAKMGRNVIAVDPLSSNVQRLCASIQDNKFGSKMKLIYNALSDKRGHVSLGKDNRNIGGTFVVDRGNANKIQGSNLNGQFSEDVITCKLDDLLLLPGFDFRKIIMKMDVEGYEGYVLKGGQRFFETVDVQAVFMEWMWLKAGSVTQEVIQFFISRGYKPYISLSGQELHIEDATNWPVDMMWKKV